MDGNRKLATNLGALGDAIYAKTAEIAEAEEKVKELQAERREMENQLLTAMQEVGTDIVRGQTATVSIKENTRIGIADYDEFVRFVTRRKALQLFERRIAQNAAKELREALGKPLPGTNEFTQLSLNVRRA